MTDATKGKENGRDETLDTIVNAEKLTATRIARFLANRGHLRAARQVADNWDIPRGLFE